MWITQSYLGSVEPDADVFVYYLYEDYVREQKQFTEKIQRELERMGDRYSDNVSLLMPNPIYADKIEAEVREIKPLWNHVHQALPGLLVSRVPFTQIEKVADECYYIPFSVESTFLVKDTIRKAMSLVNKELLVKRTYRDDEVNPIYRKIGDAVELKPGLFGFCIDLKKLFF